jgi:hypothetical protein
MPTVGLLGHEEQESNRVWEILETYGHFLGPSGFPSGIAFGKHMTSCSHCCNAAMSKERAILVRL